MRRSQYANVIGAVQDATEEELLAATRTIVREARAARREKAEALVSTLTEFDSDVADSVDLGSARAHVAAESLLRASGILQPTDDEYAAAWQAVTEPSPQVSETSPGLRHDPDPAVDTRALLIARERHLLDDSTTGELDQQSYDECAREARRLLSGGRS